MLQELGLEDMSPHPILALNENASTTNGGLWSSKSSSGKVINGRDAKYEDTIDLSNELKNAAEQCQILAEKLKKKGDEKLRASEPRVATPPPMATTSTSCCQNVNQSDESGECCGEEKEKLRTASAENIRLKQVVKDVSDINKRWQKYNRQQQDYVQKLLADIRKLQEQKSDAEVEALLRRSSTGRNAPENDGSEAKRPPKQLTFRHSDSSLIDNSAVVEALRQSYENAVKENCRLEKELEECNTREAISRADHEEANKKHKEQLELLDYQLKVNKEDWEAEKSEKEQEKATNQRLNEELKKIKTKCNNYSERLNLIEQTCRCTSTDFEYVPLMIESSGPSVRCLRRHQSFSPTRRSGRGTFWVCDGSSSADGSPSHDGNDVEPYLTRGGATNVKSETKMTNSAAVRENPDAISRNESFELLENAKSRNEPLECPGCRKEFPTELHLNFLDHFEECQMGKK